MNKLFLFIAIILINFNSLAQKRRNVSFFDKNNVPTKNSDELYFRRVIEEPDSGFTLYNLNEFYADNTQKTIGFLSDFRNSTSYEGILKKFNKNGILTEQLTYKNGKLLGQAIFFYDNGKPKKELLYLENNKKPTESLNPADIKFKYVSFYDSLDNQTVKNGKGFYKDDREEGNYVEGEKNGIWKGKIGSDVYEESYKDGELISGIAMLSNGKINKYRTIGNPPEYRGGISEFYSYLGKNFYYPKQALEAKKEGRLFISFTIDRDGTLTDIEFKNKPLGYGIEEEADVVLKNCKNWFPGIQHGIPVRVKYNIVFNVKLGSR